MKHYCILILLAASAFESAAENWPAWRGPRGDGTSLDQNAPTQWDVGSNALWTTAVPGIGHASAIVWGDRIFTVTAFPETLDRALLCFDRATGRDPLAENGCPWTAGGHP